MVVFLRKPYQNKHTIVIYLKVSWVVDLQYNLLHLHLECQRNNPGARYDKTI